MRVRNRVSHGGHGIPDEDIERRYYQSVENLNLVLPYCHSVRFYDNTDSFRRIASYEKGVLVPFDENAPLPTWFTTYIHL